VYIYVSLQDPKPEKINLTTVSEKIEFQVILDPSFTIPLNFNEGQLFSSSV